MARRSSRKKSSTKKDSVESQFAYDPFRGIDTVTLRELLEDVFTDNRDMEIEECDDIFSGPKALNVNSLIYGGGGDRPLHYVAHRGNAHCVRLLLEAGADPNAKGEMEVSPLYWAVSQGNFEVARLLLEAGAGIDHMNELGSSDLGVCSPGGYKPNPKMFRLLQSYWPGILPKDVKSRKY